MKQRSPQDKKRLSLKKDRRNDYWENAKASRKSIPRRKKAQRRAERRIPKQVIAAAASEPLPELDDAIKSRMASHATWRWKKVPDTPLGEVIARKQCRRRGES